MTQTNQRTGQLHTRKRRKETDWHDSRVLQVSVRKEKRVISAHEKHFCDPGPIQSIIDITLLFSFRTETPFVNTMLMNW